MFLLWSILSAFFSEMDFNFDNVVLATSFVLPPDIEAIARKVNVEVVL